jgi:hypothetical protein
MTRRGRPAIGQARQRDMMLEDAIFFAEQGLTDLEIMRRQGYTNRESWLRCLTRAGLPKVGPQKNYQVSVRARLIGYVFEPAPLKHGTATGYSHGLCRCEDCRAWNRKRNKQQRARLHRTVPPAKVHGTENGYSNYGCRCDKCRMAMSVVNRRRYAARKARDVL